MTDEASAADSPPRPAVPIPGARYLYVIFDGPERNFVHIEEEGRCLHAVAMSVWKERGDGLWSLGPFLQPPATVTIRPCSLCNEGWVCEAHPEKGWPHDDCAGPGMPCQRCTQAAYPTAAEQPATDLGAMVAAILAEASFPEFRKADRMELSVKLSAIHDTAQRLKVALEEREGVMEEMAKALEAMLVVVAVSKGIDGWHLNGALAEWDEFDFVADALAAFAKYKEMHQPREVSSTEGEQ